MNAESETKTNKQTLTISKKDLQGVQLRKTDSLGKSNEKFASFTSADFGSTKGDLIAELKLSHTAGGVSKLKSEQIKAQNELEKEKYKKFLEKFTPENFLSKIPINDPSGNEIPSWKREMMAKKAAEKAKNEAIEKRAKMEEERRQMNIPAWKKQLLEKKGEEMLRAEKNEREKERKKKLICKL